MAVIQVMDAIMTAGQSSRFYKSLVYDQQLAADANSFLDVTAQLRHQLIREIYLERLRP